MNTPIHIRPVDAACREAVLALRVHAGQQAWVGRIADQLADIDACPGSDALAFCADERVVGCCRIDHDATSVTGRPLPAPALGLRGMRVDRDAQGSGVGRRALDALCIYLAPRHPGHRHLVLAVAPDNHVARACYRRAGFIDAGSLYHGGPDGELLLMRRDLTDPTRNPRMVVHETLPT